MFLPPILPFPLTVAYHHLCEEEPGDSPQKRKVFKANQSLKNGVIMEYGQLYKNERAENLRSKIMVLKSSIELLEFNFKSTYEKYLSKELLPPFLFPEMTFRRLKSRITHLKYLIESTITELPIGFLEAEFLSKIDIKLNRIMDSATKLQELLVQRTAGIEAFDNVDYHVNFQIEYSGLTKVFNAVDALVYELVKRSMGITCQRG